MSVIFSKLVFKCIILFRILQSNPSLRLCCRNDVFGFLFFFILLLICVSTANLLYWCDANGESSRIEVVSLDGFNRRILTNLSSTSHPFGLAINGDLLFYTDWNMNALLAIERFERSPRALHFGPKIFMRMHGIASSYFIEPDSGGGK